MRKRLTFSDERGDKIIHFLERFRILIYSFPGAYQRVLIGIMGIGSVIIVSFVITRKLMASVAHMWRFVKYFTFVREVVRTDINTCMAVSTWTSTASSVFT
ncbi:hypothetical protein [Butyrivibrio sp. CB08]|uniref:hypothetical protein n=1 Tax=Butyrivibrio sp. CB08 TaxID=2364879 RepID=UPI001FAAF2D6|nr:hypothetical protein [Butyrivibrio sp. CB08]